MNPKIPECAPAVGSISSLSPSAFGELLMTRADNPSLTSPMETYTDSIMNDSCVLTPYTILPPMSSTINQVQSNPCSSDAARRCSLPGTKYVAPLMIRRGTPELREYGMTDKVIPVPKEGTAPLMFSPPITEGSQSVGVDDTNQQSATQLNSKVVYIRPAAPTMPETSIPASTTASSWLSVQGESSNKVYHVPAPKPISSLPVQTAKPQLPSVTGPSLPVFSAVDASQRSINSKPAALVTVSKAPSDFVHMSSTRIDSNSGFHRSSVCTAQDSSVTEGISSKISFGYPVSRSTTEDANNSNYSTQNMLAPASYTPPTQVTPAIPAESPAPVAPTPETRPVILSSNATEHSKTPSSTTLHTITQPPYNAVALSATSRTGAEPAVSSPIRYVSACTSPIASTQGDIATEEAELAVTPNQMGSLVSPPRSSSIPSDFQSYPSSSFVYASRSKLVPGPNGTLRLVPAEDAVSSQPNFYQTNPSADYGGKVSEGGGRARQLSGKELEDAASKAAALASHLRRKTLETNQVPPVAYRKPSTPEAFMFSTPPGVGEFSSFGWSNLLSSKSSQQPSSIGGQSSSFPEADLNSRMAADARAAATAAAMELSRHR
eukprot:Filipodium_phascolosomae@DN818_c0_g1_i1.p1